MERIMSSLYVRLKGGHVSNAILSSLQHSLCTMSPVAVNDIGDDISEDLTRIWAVRSVSQDSVFCIILTNFRVCTVNSNHYLTVTVKTVHQGISLLKSVHCVIDGD